MHKLLRVALSVSLIVGTAPAVFAQPPAPEAIDATLDQLLQLDPAAVAADIAAARAQAETQAAEAAKLRQQAEGLEQQAAGIESQLTSIKAHVEKLFAAFGIAAGAPAPPQMAEMAPAAPMAGAAPAEGEMKEAAATFSNFDEHIKPILQQRCARCHNDDKKKSGLSVATFAALMAGGSSGQVVTPGDADGSRILKLITKQEEPFMPPSGDPLPEEEIALIRKWIQEGALQNASSTPMAKKEEAPKDTQDAFVAATFSETPPLPEVQLAAAHALQTRGVVARAIDANPRAPLLAVGSDRQVLLYNTDTNALLGALPFPEGDIFTLSFSLNGELLAVGGGEEGNSGLCAVFSIRTGERVGTFGEGYDTVLAADISPDHRMIAVGGPNKKVYVYSMENGQELYKIEPHTDWIYAVKFTPDGEVLATADRAGGLYLWQAANGRQVEQLRGHEGAIHALAYTPDSTFLVSAGMDGTVQVWDTWKYTRVRSFKAHPSPVLGLDVSPSSQIITVSSDGNAKLWTAEGKEIKSFPGLGDWGYDADFSYDGNLVIGGSWTGAVLLWKTESAELLATLDTNPGPPATQMAAAQ